MEFVIGEQGFFEQVTAQPRATAEIADIEAPPARKTDIASNPGYVGRAGAEDHHRSIMVTECTLKCDDAVRINQGIPERQHGLKLGGIAPDICTGKTKNCR